MTPAQGALERIEGKIRVSRGHPVLLDTDLAGIYGVTAERMHEVVRRHEPLPGDFCFQPESDELRRWGESTSRRQVRYVFTEHGSFLIATFLNTSEAIAASVRIVRAFVRLRHQGWGGEGFRQALDSRSCPRALTR